VELLSSSPFLVSILYHPKLERKRFFKNLFVKISSIVKCSVPNAEK